MPPILFPMRNMPIQVVRSGQQRPSPRLITGFQPMPYHPSYNLSGITRDSTGAVLGDCRVQVFETATDRYVTEVTSALTTGAYVIPVGIGTGPYYLVAYKVGAPDLAGTTVDTLTGS